MTGIPVQPVYPYPQDPKAGPVPPSLASCTRLVLLRPSIRSTRRGPCLQPCSSTPLRAPQPSYPGA